MTAVQSSVQKQLATVVETTFHDALFHETGVQSDEAERALQSLIQTLGATETQVKHVKKEQLEETVRQLTFDGSELWAKLAPKPDEWHATLRDKGYDETLQATIDPLLQDVYHRVFDQAVEKFGATEFVPFITVQSMAIAAYLVAAELAGDTAFTEALTEVYTSGHIIIGLRGNVLHYA